MNWLALQSYSIFLLLVMTWMVCSEITGNAATRGNNRFFIFIVVVCRKWVNELTLAYQFRFISSKFLKHSAIYYKNWMNENGTIDVIFVDVFIEMRIL